MSSFHGKVDTLGLSFFGSMTASISHEMKNALAVINENAGLLGDLVGLAEKGRPLDLERLKTISENIRRRVQSADDIVRKLNRFAHSANQPVLTTDIREIFEFTVALAERLATMKGVTFAVIPSEEIQVQTLPFVVENLLWICLKNLFLVTSGNQHVEIGAQSEGSDIVIFLKFSPEIPVAQIETMIASEAQPLIFFLRMQVNADIQNCQLRLQMPKKFIE
jgi:signal transduction histidine kinase